jgi:nitroreductase
MSFEHDIAEILKCGVLAPSTHNVQPWLFKINRNSCFIIPNLKLHLKEADPDKRYLYLSIGCCLENIIIAAANFGFSTKINFFDEKENAPIVEVVFEKDKEKKNDIQKELFAVIPIRKTRRGIFTGRSIDDTFIESFSKLNNIEGVTVCLVNDPEKREKIAKLTAKGVSKAYSKRPFRIEMANLINNCLSKRKIGMPTYSINIPWFISFFVSPVIKLFNISGVLAMLNYKTLSSAPLHYIVSVKKHTIINWINAGRISERFQLAVQAKGLASSIAISSTVDEKINSRLRDLLNINDLPIFVFGVGYMSGTKKNTRKLDLGDVLV